MLVPLLSAVVRLKPRGVRLKPDTPVLLVAAVVCLCAAREQATEMRIRLKSVEFDPLTAKQVVVPPDWDRWIVQFGRPLTREDMERVQREYGLALQRYVPEGAYLERADAQLAARLRRDPLVRWVGPYLPEYKLDPAVARRRGADPARDLTVVAEGYADVPGEDLLAAIRRAGFSRAEALRVPLGGTPRVRVHVPPSADVNALTRLREVFFIEPAPRMVIDRQE